MIPTQTTATVLGNIAPTKQRQMGIDENALAAVTDSMANLYTDKHLAVLREYSTNARDSIIAAGKDEPVLVTLPGELDPTLVIQDHGLGMSEEEVLDFYSQYGSSNKRDSNTQMGAFGFGCKAAFCISDQFVVTAVKDGMETVALFSRNERGIGMASIISHGATREQNGVKVAIPIPTTDFKEFEATAAYLFSFWPKGSVLVDGEAPLSILDLSVEISPTMRWLDSRATRSIASTSNLDDEGVCSILDRLHRVTVVMGCVPYNVTTLNITPALGTFGRFVIWANIGDVDLVPSREGLLQTPKTAAFVERQKSEVKDALSQFIQKRVEDAESLYHAVLFASQFHELIDYSTNKSLRYNDQKLDPYLILNGAAGGELGYQRLGRKCLTTNRSNTLAIGEVGNTLVVTEMEIAGRAFPANSRRVLESFDRTRIIFVPTADYTVGWFSVKPGSETPGLKIISAEEFTAERIRITREERATKRRDQATKPATVTYDLIQDGDWADATPSELTRYPDLSYLTRTEYTNLGYSAKRLTMEPHNLLIVVLRRGQKVDALLKRVPHAIPFVKRVENLIDCTLSSLDERETRIQSVLLAGDWTYGDLVDHIEGMVDRINDPILREIFEVLQGETPSSLSPAIADLRSIGTALNIQSWLDFCRLGSSYQSDHYPLLKKNNAAYGISPEHIITYVNAIYESTQSVSVPSHATSEPVAA